MYSNIVNLPPMFLDEVFESDCCGHSDIDVGRRIGSELNQFHGVSRSFRDCQQVVLGWWRRFTLAAM